MIYWAFIVQSGMYYSTYGNKALRLPQQNPYTFLLQESKHTIKPYLKHEELMRHKNIGKFCKRNPSFQNYIIIECCQHTSESWCAKLIYLEYSTKCNVQTIKQCKEIGCLKTYNK